MEGKREKYKRSEDTRGVRERKEESGGRRLVAKRWDILKRPKELCSLSGAPVKSITVWITAQMSPSWSWIGGELSRSHLGIGGEWKTDRIGEWAGNCKQLVLTVLDWSHRLRRTTLKVLESFLSGAVGAPTLFIYIYYILYIYIVWF